MDPISEKRLADIVATGPDSISEADAGFLRARESYLSDEQRAVFAAILRDVAVEEAVAQQPAEQAADEKAKKPAAKKPAAKKSAE